MTNSKGGGDMKIWLLTLVILAIGCTFPVEKESDMQNFGGKPKDGWQQSGTLFTAKPDQMVTCQANFAKAEYYTVQLAVIQTPDITAPGYIGLGTYAAEADIEWSVEGSTVRRTVSLGNGVSISGTGQAVKVTLRDVSDPAIGVSPYIVQVQIAPGTRPAKSQPPTLQGFIVTQILGVAPAFIDLPIPPNAGVISVETSGALFLLGVNFRDNTRVSHRNAFGQIIKAYDPTQEVGFVPVAPNATFVRITNLSANIFQVNFTWGIDG